MDCEVAKELDVWINWKDEDFRTSKLISLWSDLEGSCTRDYAVFGLHPPSDDILKKTMFRKLVLLPSSDEKMRHLVYW